MPTAAASFDDAIDFDEPARKKAPRRPRAAAARKGQARRKGKPPRRFTFDMHRVARYAAIGMSASLALAIMLNALVLQKGHHPAPLFGKAIALGPSTTPAPQVAPAKRAVPYGSASTPAAAPIALPSKTAGAETPEPSSDDDPIAQLIQGKVPAAPTASRPDSRTVMGAQRALAKLGFALKPNGTLGPQTRKAIVAFERARHLPVNDEPTRRLIKILAAESGVKID